MLCTPFGTEARHGGLGNEFTAAPLTGFLNSYVAMQK